MAIGEASNPERADLLRRAGLTRAGQFTEGAGDEAGWGAMRTTGR